MRKLLLFICFYSVVISVANAQQITITGKIIDDHTEEPMPFASVYFDGAQIGTTTDLEGNYELIAKRVGDSLAVSVVGYRKIKKYVSTEPIQVINFRLVSTEFSLEEVVISAGENPANILLKKIIAHKDENDPAKIEILKQESYNKMELDLDNITEKVKQNKLFKPFSFIFDNVDSVSEEKPYLPMFITETLSDIAVDKSKNKKKETIKATKISGLKNESVTQFLGSMYQNINIYDNWMPILGKTFPSPISNAGLFYYKYYLIDSQTIDNRWCYKMKFKPRRTTEPTFFGEFWVVDTLFCIQQITMNLSSEANVNFVDRLSVFQQYKPSKIGRYMLTKDKLIIDFIAPKNSPGILGRRTSFYKNFEFEKEEVSKYLDFADDIKIADDAYERSNEFWDTMRHEKLSVNETKIYKMVDSIKNVPIFKTYVDVITTIVSGYYEIGPIEIGPYAKMWSNNDYDGDRFRLGIETSKKFFKGGWIEPYVAYGVKRKEWYWGIAGKILTNRKPWQYVGFSYSDDLNIQSMSNEELGADNLLSGLYRRQDIEQRLIRNQHYILYYNADLIKGFQIAPSVEYKYSKPLFKEIIPQLDFVYFDENGIEHHTTRTAEAGLKIRFAYKEKFVNDVRSRISLGTKYPTVELKYNLGVKGVFGSQFNYHKVELTIYDRFRVNAIGWSEYTFSTGKVFGKLPTILLEVHPGNQTFFYNTYAFNMMNMQEFASDVYASLLFTHHFEGLFLDQSPLIRKLKLRWCATGKIVWGQMSGENQFLNRYNYTYVNKDDSNQKIRVRAPYYKPYAEASVGLENILKLFRVDAIWRLTYLDNPEAKRFGVRAGMRLTF